MGARKRAVTRRGSLVRRREAPLPSRRIGRCVTPSRLRSNRIEAPQFVTPSRLRSNRIEAPQFVTPSRLRSNRIEAPQFVTPSRL
uniref:Uncharacterized protein n=1 Tax=mine drainage metagenome TaxID=410659 RepID=E6Q6T3_9ZZZZ